MKQYFERSLRYMLRMIIIIGLIFAVMDMFNLLETGGQGLFKALFYSNNGLILIVALVVLAAVYPKMAFAKLTMQADIKEDRKSILEAMKSYGYSPVSQADDKLVFRADKLAKKIASQFDDTVTMTKEGELLAIEGLKKDVLRIQLRINAFIVK